MLHLLKRKGGIRGAEKDKKLSINEINVNGSRATICSSYSLFIIKYNCSFKGLPLFNGNTSSAAVKGLIKHPISSC